MKIIKKVLINIFIITFFCSLLFGQPSENKNELLFYTDAAGFRGQVKDVKTYQEIYISFPNYQLTYTHKNGLYLAAYQISLSIKNTDGEQIKEKEWQGFSQIDSLKQAQGLTTLEIAGFLLEPGEYSAKITVTDLEDKRSGSAVTSLQTPRFSNQALQISEIEFARSIKKTSKSSKFVKNSVEILPNPSRVFGIESPFIYFYAEIYNIKQPTELLKEHIILDSRGDTVKYSKKMLQSKSNSVVWAEKVNTIDLISNKYFLGLRITDKSTGEVTAKEAEFWIHNPYKAISLKQYREEDIEEFRAQIYYIVNEDELAFFDRLNTKGKIEYINNFWKDKDPDFRTEHLKRFYTAQERFESQTMPGWKSDQGRVYIIYGPPDEVDRHPSTATARSYEIWIYERLENQGRVEFVFVDFGIFGNYQLVHSTLKSGQRAEIYNPNWKEEISISR